MSVNPPPPVGRYWKRTEATPDVESDAAAVSGAAGPPISAPAAGRVSDTVGAVLSTRVVTIGLVPTWPDWSVATARRS